MRLLVSMRVRRGLSQTAVAKAMGVSQAKVSRIERGLGEVTISEMQRYARAVGCRLIVEVTVDPL